MINKILVTLSSFLLFTLSSSTNEAVFKTFNEWHNEYLDLFSDSPHPRIIDENCVKSKLNFERNVNKMIERKQAIDTIALGYNLCTQGIEETLEMAVWFLTTRISEEFESKADCFKKELKKIEPNAKIIEKFNENSMTVSNEECKTIVKSENFQKFMSDVLGNLAITEDACDTLTENDVKSFCYHMYIFKFENLYDLESERKILAEKMLEIQKKFFDCQIEKINEMK